VEVVPTQTTWCVDLHVANVDKRIKHEVSWGNTIKKNMQHNVTTSAVALKIGSSTKKKSSSSN
jgi:hypothetical protein